MVSGETVRGATIAQAWERGLDLFRDLARLHRHDSERGVAFELPGLTVVIESAADLTTPARYTYPELIEESPFPVSPVTGCFRVIDAAVHLFLVARSLDYWVGAVPELIAFSRLLAQVASELGREVGAVTYHVWSAHVYESDLLAHVSGGY